jgi:hypothetical protein
LAVRKLSITGFEEINCDLPEADFWPGTTNGMVRRLYQQLGYKR